jgi:aspartate-semialdehyde dehydrogenase
MNRVGFVGWRGMVGSVLMERMREEDDFARSPSRLLHHLAAGRAGPDVGQGAAAAA